jgi:hypothetical protein
LAGRLEVMKEDLYNELVKSWNNGLSGLISKYKPNYIVYNYLKYYTWTEQIAAMAEWKLIYLDGISAIFALSDDAKSPEAIDFTTFPAKYALPEITDNKEKLRIINLTPVSNFASWMQGFYKKVVLLSNNMQQLKDFSLKL